MITFFKWGFTNFSISSTEIEPIEKILLLWYSNPSWNICQGISLKWRESQQLVYLWQKCFCRVSSITFTDFMNFCIHCKIYKFTHSAMNLYLCKQWWVNCKEVARVPTVNWGKRMFGRTHFICSHFISEHFPLMTAAQKGPWIYTHPCLCMQSKLPGGQELVNNEYLKEAMREAIVGKVK